MEKNLLIKKKKKKKIQSSPFPPLFFSLLPQTSWKKNILIINKVEKIGLTNPSHSLHKDRKNKK